MSRQAIKLAQLSLRSGAEYVAECARLKAAGELDRRFVVYGMEGAAEYVRAIAAGDVASKADSDARHATCGACPSRTAHKTRPDRGYCGPALRDRHDADPPTCGCPIDALVLVASRACPQRRFGPVPKEI